eukprot:scaffold2142_cov190-Cylindrotheca_fusiformis.AAC.2
MRITYIVHGLVFIREAISAATNTSSHTPNPNKAQKPLQHCAVSDADPANVSCSTRGTLGWCPCANETCKRIYRNGTSMICLVVDVVDSLIISQKCTPQQQFSSGSLLFFA